MIFFPEEEEEKLLITVVKNNHHSKRSDLSELSLFRGRSSLTCLLFKIRLHLVKRSNVSDDSIKFFPRLPLNIKAVFL